MTVFNNVPTINFEGAASANDFSFKHYDKDATVMGKSMDEWLRFSVAYWHTHTFGGEDPFGGPTMERSYQKYSGMDLAKARVEANFELLNKLGITRFAFHDIDIAPEGNSLKETYQNIDTITAMLKDNMKEHGIGLLWNTANMFVDRRFMHGAATTNNADVYAYAAAKVKKQLEVAKDLGAQNYVFWGGREGYETLLNTDMKREMDNLARFYHMAVDYAKEIGFEGQMLIEPKPREPMKHQYDFDVATAYAFLQKYDLDSHFKMNIESNHATLAGHTFEHELRYAREMGILGSVDANQGDLLLGWDTDEFPTDIYDATLAMYEILKNDGLGSGGLNFDAKVRRPSHKPEDLFHAHIAGMDTFAYGLKAASQLIEDRVFENIVEERYSSFDKGVGSDILAGKTSFKELEAYALELQEPIEHQSGKQELIKAKLNQYILNANNKVKV